jgi:hypothetical protein
MFFVSLALLQCVFLLMTYANISSTADRGARYMSMGIPPSLVTEKIKSELAKFNFFNSDPVIVIDNHLLAELSVYQVQISLPIDWPFGINFNLVTTSHAL